MVSTPVGKAGRWPDGGGLFAFPMTPPPQPLPSAAGKDKGKDLSSDQKKEILQTDHFQVWTIWTSYRQSRERRDHSLGMDTPGAPGA